MNCVLFAKMDQVFSKENQTLKKYWKIGEKYWKSQGKVREFCQSGKVGTLSSLVNRLTDTCKNITFSQFCLWMVIMHYPWAGSWVHFQLDDVLV